ncbi:hypothetical protein KIPE111705_32695 [Kibdelosporangium persicum]
MPLVLAKCVPEVGLVPDQRAVQQFSAERFHPGTVIAFMRGIRTPASTVAIPALLGIL